MLTLTRTKVRPKRRAFFCFKLMWSMLVATTNSTPVLQDWCSSQQTQSSSALTHLFRRDKIESLRWLHVIKFPPFTIFGLPPWLAA